MVYDSMSSVCAISIKYNKNKVLKVWAIVGHGLKIYEDVLSRSYNSNDKKVEVDLATEGSNVDKIFDEKWIQDG